MKEQDNVLLYRIAKKYYIEGKLQNEIAKEEGISRSMVSKLLTRAREAGIARVEVSMPKARSIGAMERECREMLGVREVHIVESRESCESEGEQIKVFCSQAADIVPGLIKGSSVVGLGTGRTIYGISEELRPAADPYDITFIPLVGNASPHNRYLQTSTMVSRFADRFLGSCFFVNHYYRNQVGEYEEGYKDYNLENAEEMESLWHEMDCAIFSLSNASSDAQYFSMRYNDRLLDDHLHHYPDSDGELLSQIFFSDGRVRPLSITENYVALAYPLDRLSHIKTSICMAVGDSKAPVIIRAARHGYFNSLVTDAATAGKILELRDDPQINGSPFHV